MKRRAGPASKAAVVSAAGFEQASGQGRPSVQGKRGGSGDVRIIGGIWKRSRLRVLTRPGLRPTPDRVRETLFNWLGADLSGWRVLDAFAGSGALGLEAASRGASEVVLLDHDVHAVRELEAAHRRLHAPPTVRIDRAEALAWMARHPAASFELVFVDPPFDTQQAAQAAAQALRLLVSGGWLVVESPEPLTNQDLFPPESEAPDSGVELKKHLKAGAVHLQLFQRAGLL